VKRTPPRRIELERTEAVDGAAAGHGGRGDHVITQRICYANRSESIENAYNQKESQKDDDAVRATPRNGKTAVRRSQ